MLRLRTFALVFVVACGAPQHAGPSGPVTFSIIGTNDQHGHILPDESGKGGAALFASYVAAARKAHPVILLDAGDDFQGTMESNLNEGAAVVQVMNAIGYDAMAIGNHEFDFGPVGPRTTALPEDDPQGALKARAAEAHYPILAANLIDESNGGPIAWKNVYPSVVIEREGVKIGIIGVTTLDTPATTTPPNFRGLRIQGIAQAITREVATVRAQGAQLVIVAAHAGAKCKTADHPDDPVADGCDDGEIFQAARALHPGTVDVIVAGHTHDLVAHRVNGIAIVQAYFHAQAFDRVDVTLDRASGKIQKVEIFTPQRIEAGTYEGQTIAPDPQIAALVAPYAEAARARKEEKLGVTVTRRVKKVYDHESALGNFFADMMRAARPGADVALTNGGGLRTHLEAGELTYGRVFEAYPFDNRFATVKISGKLLARALKENLLASRGILSVSGVRAAARCEGNDLKVTLTREDGRPIADNEVLTMITSDFLAGGGDNSSFGVKPGAITIDEELVREGIIAQLRKRGGEVDGEDPKIFDPAHPRLDYPGKDRPVVCNAAP